MNDQYLQQQVDRHDESMELLSDRNYIEELERDNEELRQRILDLEEDLKDANGYEVDAKNERRSDLLGIIQYVEDLLSE